MNSNMLSRRLIRRGWEVLFAEDGRAGVESATSEQPDLILMDLSLPEIDGWTATRMIKRDPRTQHSRIEVGRMDIHSEPATVRSLINDVSATIQPLAWKSGNEFVTEMPEHDYIVNVDTIRFRQNLLNLLSNACKFTERGKVSLTVNRKIAEGASWVCFEVRDTGQGIAPEDMNKLFKAFSQVDSSATRKHGGTGLGLAISQRFFQMMGGAITVESEQGIGATFTIRLPESTKEFTALAETVPSDG